MQHSTQRPYEDGNQVTFLGTHPVNKLTCEEVGNSIEQREETCNRTIVTVRPVELWGYEVFPCQRQDLTIHIVYSSC